MTSEKVQGAQPDPQSPRDGIIKKIIHAALSLIVGISTFFILKLIFMIPLNLAVNPRHAESLGAILVIVSVYLAIKFTKFVNRKTKERTKWRIATIAAGFLSMIASNLILIISKAT